MTAFYRRRDRFGSVAEGVRMQVRLQRIFTVPKTNTAPLKARMGSSSSLKYTGMHPRATFIRSLSRYIRFLGTIWHRSQGSNPFQSLAYPLLTMSSKGYSSSFLPPGIFLALLVPFLVLRRMRPSVESEDTGHGYNC